MRTNPLLLTDFYKIGHPFQYPKGTTKVYSNLTPRKSRMNGVDEFVFFGLQYFIKEYLIESFNENFFNVEKDIVISEYKRRVKNGLGGDLQSYEHIEKLHDLGYLPIEIKALPEGSTVDMKVPVLTIVNTLPEFYWLTNFIESIMSATLWQPCTSATIAKQYRKILDKYAKETGMSSDFVQWQGHDFSFRGMSSLESAILSGMGHLLYFTGTDTIPSIDALEYYYNANSDNELIGGSVPATEHSVMCSGEKDGELDTFKRLITEIYPSGIVSIVSDTWDLWKVCTEYLVKLKEDILSRDGKVVIRPDCLDDKSQILTPKGWKFFKDLEETDLVAQVKEDCTYEFVKPLTIINEPYEGDMYEIRDFHGKIDLVVTPEHRIVSYKNLDNSVFIKEASEYKQNNWKYKKLRSPKSQSKCKELTHYERFLIALQADGCIRYVNENLSTRVEFCFQKKRKHDRLLEILEKLDLKYNVYFSKSRNGQSTFSILIPQDKKISKTFNWVDTSNLDSLWSEQFIEELKYWDSSIRNEGRFKYDTTIKENIDVVELVAIAAGKGVYISEWEDNRKEHFSNVYTAHILNNPYAGGQSITKNKIHYKGTIHCVKVPTGMILVKRNKGICVTGNSGDPVNILCGLNSKTHFSPTNKNLPEDKGVVELLWDVFGGTINEEGYKVLDSHIGVIYGDSITLQRAEEICKRLKDKGFASQVVFGIGSYTYQYNTRDTFGIAMKATYVEIDGKSIDIFKNPITDDGTKKSAKGLLSVKMEKGKYVLTDSVTWEQENESDLITVFKDGKLIKEYSLNEIRNNIKK